MVATTELGTLPRTPPSIVADARARADALAVRAGADDEVSRVLAVAADRFVVRTSNGPTAVAGYPWFGEWSRDLFTSYEGLFLCTGRRGRGPGGAAAGGRERVGGHARQHRRRRHAGVQHHRRHALVPARPGPTRRPDRRPRPRGRAVRDGRGHPVRARGRHPVRHRGRHRDRPAARGSGRLGADLDGRADRRPPGHATRRVPGRDRGALDQRARQRCRPAGPGRPGRPDVVGPARAGDGLLRAAVRSRHVRAGRRARPDRRRGRRATTRTSSWRPRSRSAP